MRVVARLLHTPEFATEFGAAMPPGSKALGFPPSETASRGREGGERGEKEE